MTVDDVRRSLTGPLASLRTPFNRDGSIDYPGLHRQMDLAVEAGCGTSLLTAGDSHLQCMSDDEIRAITEDVARYSAGRTMVVAADWAFATPQAVDFANTCVEVGADMLMVRPPDWAKSSTIDGLVGHFAAVAEIIPVMLVTNLFKLRDIRFSLDAIEAIRDRVENVMAVKDDLEGDFARRMCMLVHDKWAVFSGGGLRNHLSLRPFGCDGFMDRFMSFRPRVSLSYWEAVQHGKVKEAVAIIRDIELPLELFLNAFPGGRDAAVHGLLEVFEIAGRWRRAPYYSLSDEEIQRLRAFVKEMGLL